MVLHYIYIVRCADDTLYTGWTTDLARRIAAHNGGTGAKYTRARRPVTLLYHETFATKEEALRREYAITQLPREKKMQLIQGSTQEETP